MGKAYFHQMSILIQLRGIAARSCRLPRTTQSRPHRRCDVSLFCRPYQAVLSTQHFTQRNTAPYTMLALRIDHAELRTDRADIHHCSHVLSQQSMMTVNGIDIEYPLASWWRRFAATAIDIGLFIGGLHLSYHAFWPFAWLVGPGAGTVAAGAVFACSFVWQSVVYRWISPGQTP